MPNSRASTVLPLAHEYELPGSMFFTDEYKPYERLGKKGYTHRRINHHARVYVDGDAHRQTIDGFFGLFSRACVARTMPSRTSGFRAT